MDDEREEELTSIQAIFPELSLSPTNDFTATLEVPVKLVDPLLIRFISTQTQYDTLKQDYSASATNAHIEHDISFGNLPPLRLHVALPVGYPAECPPQVSLTTLHEWLPQATLTALQTAASTLWDEYGRCQILFAYIDHLQQLAERAFDLVANSDGPVVLPLSLEQPLKKFDQDVTQATFDAGTYDCGICLEPKKGRSCYQMQKCDHIFCKQCLQDFYNNAITEGDISTIRCLDPECGKGVKGAKRLTLHPRELLLMGIDEAKVRRYVEMKRKKKLESDKTTVYCPRTWCQSPARSKKYPPIPVNLLDYPDLSDTEDNDTQAEKQRAPMVLRTAEEDERLAVCEKCQFAFCRTCSASWHGTFVRCYPRDPSELTAEEKLSYEYIQQNTSPCPTCSSPTSKTMGCNHMHCFQCATHYCYLCGAWLDAGNPYQHFNTPGGSCYQRLWELEEGDDGQMPADGRGFAGARAVEAMAIEAARNAEREEAEAAAAAEPVANVVQHIPPAQVEVIQQAIVAAPIAVVLPRNAAVRRPRNPFPQPRARGVALAVRQHERQAPQLIVGRGRERPALPALEADPREDLHRFAELALHDEGHGSDSDEATEDDT